MLYISMHYPVFLGNNLKEITSFYEMRVVSLPQECQCLKNLRREFSGMQIGKKNLNRGNAFFGALSTSVGILLLFVLVFL